MVAAPEGACGTCCTSNRKFGFIYIDYVRVHGRLEPLWPANAGKTTTDGDIVWKCWTENGSACTAGNNPWTIKNNFELKSSRNMHIHHNVFDQMWVDGQETQVNLKNENRSRFRDLRSEYSGRVTLKRTDKRMW